MGNQPDHENNAPVTNAELGDVPDETSGESGTTSPVIRSTRTSRAWIGVLPVLVVLTIILAFVFQNSKDVKVSLLSFSGTLPLSVALLGAVILGALMVLTLGTVRIFQLRKQVHRMLKRSDGDNRRTR